MDNMRDADGWKPKSVSGRVGFQKGNLRHLVGKAHSGAFKVPRSRINGGQMDRQKTRQVIAWMIVIGWGLTIGGAIMAVFSIIAQSWWMVAVNLFTFSVGIWSIHLNMKRREEL